MTGWREIRGEARRRANVRIRRAAGLEGDPPPLCSDPAEAYGDVYGVARVVHGDLASMLIGGVASLYFQMLHPYAMAGVAQFSRYQEDPLGRLLQTANFISATTYGSRSRARTAITKVQNVHRRIHGVADDGVAYDANDPHLLTWVHCAEIAMFLEGYRRYGRHRLSDDDGDHYVYEMARLARDVGVSNPPESVAQLREALLAFRGELRLSADGAVARDFLARGEMMRTRTQRRAYRIIERAARGLLDPWARELLGEPRTPRRERLTVPSARLLCRLMRLAVPPPQLNRVRPPSTTTT